MAILPSRISFLRFKMSASIIRSTLLIAAVAGSLACWIWGHTGEILLDFGGQLYIAWQVSIGKVLYRDVSSVYGPLSPCLNAIVMKLFGPSLNVILTANLIILGFITAILYFLLRAMSSTFSTTVATIFFLSVFALSAPTRLANYNFLTPYAHEMTHGFLLCLAAIACIEWFSHKQTLLPVFAGGLLTGLAFLTKPEIFLGCAAAFYLGLLAVVWTQRSKSFGRILAAALIALALPPVIALLFFSTGMPLKAAFSSVIGGWQFINQPFVVSSNFYKGSFGTDEPLRNLRLMLQYTALYSLLAAGLASISIACRLHSQSLVHGLGILFAVLTFFLITAIGDHFDSFWSDIARGLPLFAMFVVTATSLKVLKRIPHPGLQFPFAVLSLAFLAKIILFTRTYHYGFVLAAPCGMLAVVAMLDWLPHWVARKGGSATIARIGACGIFAAIIFHNLILTRQTIRERTLLVPLALGGATWTRPSDAASIDAIKWLSTTNATVAVIPDASGINYAAARPNSIPFIELNPIGLMIYGQSRIVAAFNQNPPDYILLMKFPEDAFSAHLFGEDYGLQLFAWISAHYRVAGLFLNGDHPIQMLEKKSSPYALLYPSINYSSPAHPAPPPLPTNAPNSSPNSSGTIPPRSHLP